MKPLQIGSVTLPHGLLLAPMAGVTDACFRAVCRRFGAEYTVSEMISAKALVYEQNGRASAPVRTAPLAHIEPPEMPTAVQLFGAEPDFMAEAARLLSSGAYRGAGGVRPVAIDLNMGCPVHKVVANGEGAALMRDPARAAAIVRAVKAATDLPVTVKMRAGWDAAHKNAPEFAKAMEAAGADMICVHGRTRDQFYAPASDNAVIAAVKKAVRVPVVGNGDLFSPADVLHILKETGCDGVMLARGVLGDPFLFAAVRAAMDGTPYAPPTPRERLETALAQAADMVARRGARVGITEARKHMAWYCKGLAGAAAVRHALMNAGSLDEFRAAFSRLLSDPLL